MASPKSTPARWADRLPTSTSPWETWAGQVLSRAGLGSYVNEQIAAMARLHRENRYDRVTATVEEITGRPAESAEEFVARQSDLFAG